MFKMKQIIIKIDVRINGQKTNMACAIKDGVSLTRYSDERMGKAVYEYSKKNDDFVKYKNGILEQLYPGTTAREIRDKIIKDISKMITELKQKGFQITTKIVEKESDIN